MRSVAAGRLESICIHARLQGARAVFDGSVSVVRKLFCYRIRRQRSPGRMAGLKQQNRLDRDHLRMVDPDVQCTSCILGLTGHS